MGSKPTKIKTTFDASLFIDRIEDQQDLLFYGYIRLHILNPILNHEKNRLIPLEILHLSYKFYQINVSHRLKQLKAISDKHHFIVINKLADECGGNGEWFIAYSLAKILINSQNARQSGRGYYILACASLVWGESDPEEMFMKAIQKRPIIATYHADYAEYLFYAKGEEMIEKTRYHVEEAVKLMEAEEKCKSDNFVYNFYACVLRDYDREYEKSEKYFLKALEKRADPKITHSEYGYLLILKGKYEEAKHHLDIAQLKYNKCAMTHFYCGLLNWHFNNVELAMKSLINAIDLVKWKRSCFWEYRRYNVYHTIRHLIKQRKKNDVSHIKYYEIFEQMLFDKFQ